MNLFKSKKDLFEFKHGSRVWYFTSSAKPVIYEDNTYRPFVISRSSIEDEDIDKCSIDISFGFPRPLLNNDGDDLQVLFINKIYFNGVTCLVKELYKNETLIIFRGRVTLPKFDSSNNTMTLTCSTAESYQHRNILTRKFQRTCANKIYDRFCGLSFDEWAVDATITSVSNTSVELAVNETIDSVSDEVIDSLTGDTIRTEAITTKNSGGMSVQTIITRIDSTTSDEVIESDETEVRWQITSNNWFARGLLLKDGAYTFINSGNTISINLYRPHDGLAVGDVVKIAPGCDQSHEVCKETFNNNLRYMGFPFIPNTNPVNDQIIK